MEGTNGRKTGEKEGGEGGKIRKGEKKKGRNFFQLYFQYFYSCFELGFILCNFVCL